MSRRRIPDEVLSAAHARAEARSRRDWAEADRLRAEIEAAGWKIADRGTDFALTPAAPADVAEGERIRYGSSASVPSRLDEPAAGVATVVLIATDWPDDLARALAGIRATAPDGTSVVIVADGPSPEQAAALEALAAREPRMAPRTPRTRGGRSRSRSSGRASGSVTPPPPTSACGVPAPRSSILLDTSVEPTGDVVTPLVRALDDPTVAVAGGWGIVSTDLRKFEDAPAGDVDAIEGYLMAFRRADAAARGPLDERFRFYRNLDIWWSLVLRDEGEGSRRAAPSASTAARRPS